MVDFFKALVFLLETTLGDTESGDEHGHLELTIAAQPPAGGYDLGAVVLPFAPAPGFLVLTVTYGTGPAKQTLWTGFWSYQGGT